MNLIIPCASGAAPFGCTLGTSSGGGESPCSIAKGGDVVKGSLVTARQPLERKGNREKVRCSGKGWNLTQNVVRPCRPGFIQCQDRESSRGLFSKRKRILLTTRKV